MLEMLTGTFQTASDDHTVKSRSQADEAIGIGNSILAGPSRGGVARREQLGGLLNHDYREAA